MTEALTVQEQRQLERARPRDVIRQANEEANVLADVIESKRLFSMIQGKKFVRVEGWVTLATLRGCLPREVQVTEMPEGRYVAEVELVRMSDEVVLTKASAECGGPEDKVWMQRPPNARRSMAITRATGKACRVAFAWVLSLAGEYETTPAEEMDHVSPVEEPTYRPAERPSKLQRDLELSVEATKKPEPYRGKLRDYERKPTRNGGFFHVFVGDDGGKFRTFDEKIVDTIVTHEHDFFEIEYKDKPPYGKEIVSVRVVSDEEAPQL